MLPSAGIEGVERIVQGMGLSRTVCRAGCLLVLLTAAVASSNGQTVDDAIDDPIDCALGGATAGLLPAVVDIISIDIRKQNDDLVATVEFRGDPSIGDSVSGGIIALDPQGFDPGPDGQWHFNNAGNVAFNYAGDAVSTRKEKSVVDALGAWVTDTTTGFTATRAGNLIILRIPGAELGPGSVWMAYSTSQLFEVPPRCDVAGSDKKGLPILEVPQLVAAEDRYTAAGNLGITVPASDGVLINDIDATAIIGMDETSNYGGTVVPDTSGGFRFQPAPGFLGSDWFEYTVTDGKGGTSTASVVIDVGPALWVVDASAADPGLGTYSEPFPDITSLVQANEMKSFDAIYIFGDAVYEAGLVLHPSQVVIGQGADLLQTLQDHGFQLPPYSDLLDSLPQVGLPPMLVADSLHGIELAQHNRIAGLNIGSTPGGAAVYGDSVATLHLSNVSITGTGAILDISGGQVVVSLTSAASDSAAMDAISLEGIGGTLAVGDEVVIRAPHRHGLSVQASAVAINFGGLRVVDADSSAAISITTSPLSQFDLGSVSIHTGWGRGLEIQDGGYLSTDSGVLHTGGTPLDLRSVDLSVKLDTISSEGGLLLSLVTGSLTIGNAVLAAVTESSGLDVQESTVVSAFDALEIGKVDSGYAVRMVDNPEAVLRVGRLAIENTRGGGMLLSSLDSVSIQEGSVVTHGGRAIDLRNLVADIRLEKVSADSVDAGIRLSNVGGMFEVTGTDDPGSGGSITRVTGRAVDGRNVQRVRLSNVQFSEVTGEGVRFENFGEVHLSLLNMTQIDSAAILAVAGSLLEVATSSIMDAQTGIEAYEIGEITLIGNEITDTDSTAIVVSNTVSGTAAPNKSKRTDGDLHAMVMQNHVLTGALDGINVSAGKSGVLRLTLRGNEAISAARDYVLTVSEPASLALDGFAGGDEEAVAGFVQRVNVGEPRVHILGAIEAGPTGQADVVAIEKTVSNTEPLPERLVAYTVSVTNRGPAPALSVTVMDSLPEGLAYVPETISIDGELMSDAGDNDAADFGIARPGTVTARLGDLSMADTVVVSFQARPLQANAGTSVNNTVSIGSASPDSITANNTASVEIAIRLNTGVDSGDIPPTFSLGQSYPNPFGPSDHGTTIGFELPEREYVRLTVLNVLGQSVAELVSEEMNPGRYEIHWDARMTGGLTSSTGLYFYRLEAGRKTATRRMILLK